jgi:prolyl oligopeptidase
MMKKMCLVLSVMMASVAALYSQEDPYLWLEEVDGEKAMEFVIQQNNRSLEILSNQAEFPGIFNKTLEILNDPNRLETPSMYGNYVYNFWQDATHIRGIWRRATLQSYQSGNPLWETLLDIDAMVAQDNIKWVFKGASGLYPTYNRFLVNLSKGGGDAVVIREFDPNTKEFIENGFFIDEAKGNASYLDENTLIVSTDFGPGTMTTSGYARQVKLWKRGTPLSQAQLIFEGSEKSVSSGGGVLRDGNKQFVFVREGITFFTSQFQVLRNNKLIKLDIPETSGPSALLKNQLIIQLKSDWNVAGKNYKSGSVIALDFNKLLNNKKDITVIFQPDEFTSVRGISTTKNVLLINLLKNVSSELYTYTFEKNKWLGKKVDIPALGSVSIISTDNTTDEYFLNYTNFLTPTTIYTADAQKGNVRKVKSMPDFFDSEKYQVEQRMVASKDGTMIPYFLVSSKSIQFNGQNPTLVYAYGGFEVSSTPSYMATIASAWLENGGVYVLANIRGGGEYGPQWHQQGLKEKRQNVFDDLYAVSEDLIKRRVTSENHLGIRGGSNGGLLVGVAFTQRPDLYNAVICAVPLLDMQRYNKLLAGASWMGEYGDPDQPEQWDYISNYSPYHNLRQNMEYPQVFFHTSTRDDRVHPGHARKMAAKMIDMGYDVLYFENTEGGHAGSSTNEQRARITAMEYTYLLMRLKTGSGI